MIKKNDQKTVWLKKKWSKSRVIKKKNQVIKKTLGDQKWFCGVPNNHKAPGYDLKKELYKKKLKKTFVNKTKNSCKNFTQRPEK